jgi:hypothetical protein
MTLLVRESWRSHVEMEKQLEEAEVNMGPHDGL